MKTTPMTVAGKVYPAALTVSAALQLMEDYGDIQGAMKALQSQDLRAALADVTKISAILMAGGADYVRMMGGSINPPPIVQNLRNMVSPGELLDLRTAALRAILAGVTRQIEAEADRKNAETTSDG